jgi:hypothetical protein
MAIVKRVAELEASHAGLRGRSKELEAKVDTLEKLLSAAMAKLDELSVELDVARNVEVRLAVVVAEMGALISHFGNVANYAHSGNGNQAHALVSTYRNHIN